MKKYEEYTVKEGHEEYTVRKYQDGSKQWYNKKGELHRIKGPAMEGADGSEVWMQNDSAHRVDGPALVSACGQKLWFLDGVAVSEKDFLRMTKPSKLTLHQIETLVGFKVETVEG